MLKTIIPILVLVGAGFLGKYFMETGPEAVKRPFVRNLPIVEVAPLKTEPYTVYIKASGIVTAGTSSDVVSEVSGRIVKISDNFQEGSYFEKGKVLLEIDKSNYLSNVEIAKSDVAVNKASLVQLNAEERSNLNSIKLAKQNLSIGYKELTRLRALFKRNTISRSSLDAEEQRINQLQQAVQNLEGSQSTFASRKSAIQARIKSSQSKVKQESIQLSRATIKAPYAGRVLKKNVDIGQYVSTGSTLAETYATDFVNVELPLSLNQYKLLGIQEEFINTKVNKENLPTVTLTNTDSLSEDTWQGRVVRTGAALDAESRQISVIVRVNDPYKAQEGVSTPIRIGQYLQANIKGKTFQGVYVLPPVAVIYNREIRLLKDGKIKIVPVNVIWNSTDSTIVSTKENISGEQLILTNLTQAVNGMEVLTVEQQQAQTIANANKRKARTKKQRDQTQKAEEERKSARVIPEQISRKNIESKEESNQAERKRNPNRDNPNRDNSERRKKRLEQKQDE